ncbi:MAG: periplasmic heavy metal sensor [Hyphomicrobiaceae bacterium]|nr:MAG: periplasmic heavy metal sensor [Hyphomicrobiaceae bacterium]
MTQTASEAPRRAPRWMLVLLTVSLALNFIIVGLVAGAVWRFRSPPPWASGVTPNLLGYASTLSSERRKELWRGTEEERTRLRPFRREVRAAREDTMRALAEEPFDKQRFLAAQARQADAENRARAAVQDLYAEIAARLTVEERRAFRRWRDHRRPPGHNLLDEPEQPTAAK